MHFERMIKFIFTFENITYFIKKQRKRGAIIINNCGNK